ncbi:MAG: VOC family protein [Gammaproteobacteria bacterium]|nr:VOC family protein [Gammaproteobacteria bacterium]
MTLKTFTDAWRALAGGAALAPLLAAVLPAAAAEPVNPLQLEVRHITAAVTDIDRAVQWYQRVLGFRLVGRGERNGGAFRYAELEIPGFGVALVQLAAAQPAPLGERPLAPAWVHIVFAVPDVPAAYEALRARGAGVFTRGPATPPVTTFLLHDSEGNEIEIVAAAR